MFQEMGHFVPHDVTLPRCYCQGLSSFRSLIFCHSQQDWLPVRVTPESLLVTGEKTRCPGWAELRPFPQTDGTEELWVAWKAPKQHQTLGSERPALPLLSTRVALKLPGEQTPSNEVQVTPRLSY